MDVILRRSKWYG